MPSLQPLENVTDSSWIRHTPSTNRKERRHEPSKPIRCSGCVPQPRSWRRAKTRCIRPLERSVSRNISKSCYCKFLGSLRHLFSTATASRVISGRFASLAVLRMHAICRRSAKRLLIDAQRGCVDVPLICQPYSRAGRSCHHLDSPLFKRGCK